MTDHDPHADTSDEARPELQARAFVKRYFNVLVLGFAIIFFLLPRVSPWDGLNDNLNIISRASEWMLRKVETLFKDYGYYVVFFGVLMENSMFLGLLVPGAIILILGGLSAENGLINLWWVLGLGIVATIIGDTMSYFIGRMGWTRLIERSGMRNAMERVRGPMESNSTWIILAYHFAGYSRVVGPLAAGIFHIPYRRWAPLDYIGGSLWVVAFTMAGFVLGTFGVEFGDTKRMVQLLEYFFLGLFAVAIMLTVVQQMRRNAGDDSTPPRPPSGGGMRAPATVVVRVEDEA